MDADKIRADAEAWAKTFQSVGGVGTADSPILMIRIHAHLVALVARVEELEAAIARHHAQKADDRCQFDDDELYAAAGLPPVDRRVGDKAAMLANCARFIESRCEGGGPWKSYAELEARVEALTAALEACEVSMDTAATEGVGGLLSPTSAELWAAAHTRARELLEREG